MQAAAKALIIAILTWEARLILRRYKPRIIAITGSVGKTTTKDAIFAALSTHVHVRKSAKSYNTDIGLALTIIGTDNPHHDPWRWLHNIWRGVQLLLAKEPYPAWLVLEVGADRPGDIGRVARWLKPDIAVLTRVPEIPVHVEYFPSPEHVLKEKRSLAEYLKPGGKLILNGDDERIRALQSDFRGASVTYGMRAEHDFAASHEEIEYAEDGMPTGIRFRVDHAGSSIPVYIPGSLGSPRIYAGVAALAVAQAVGVDVVSAAQGLAAWEPTPGRVRVLRGLKGTTIIDDTYNSSPAAAMAALDTLKQVKARRRIAVLGDMLELGRYATQAHREVGEHVVGRARLLMTVGFRSRAIAEGAKEAGLPETHVISFGAAEAEQAGEVLRSQLRKGDVILVKGSQGMRMEKTVKAIMAEPERAAELLVRQEPEWR